MLDSPPPSSIKNKVKWFEELSVVDCSRHYPPLRSTRTNPATKSSSTMEHSISEGVANAGTAVQYRRVQGLNSQPSRVFRNSSATNHPPACTVPVKEEKPMQLNADSGDLVSLKINQTKYRRLRQDNYWKQNPFLNVTNHIDHSEPSPLELHNKCHKKERTNNRLRKPVPGLLEEITTSIDKENCDFESSFGRKPSSNCGKENPSKPKLPNDALSKFISLGDTDTNFEKSCESEASKEPDEERQPLSANPDLRIDNTVPSIVVSSPTANGENRIPLKIQVGRKRRTLKRVWEVTYALLAFMELLTCSQWMPTELRLMTPPLLESCSRPEAVPSFYFAKQTTCDPTAGIMQGKEKNSVLREEGLKFRVKKTWSAFYHKVHHKSWQDTINKCFIVALIIQVSIASWTRASAKNKKKHEKEESKNLQSSFKVTGRSKRRAIALETISSNRHFIMRWSRNRIRWSRTTTEIFCATVFLLLANLVLMPIIRNNPFENQKVAEIQFPQILLGKKKSAEVVNATYSLCEIFFLKLSTWFHSAAVTRFRRTCKSLVFRTVKALVLRPTRINKAFTAIRWAKFLAPLVGTCNKARGHIIDFLEKKELRKRRNRANLLWKNLFSEIGKKHRAERAARVLQRHFREKRQQAENHVSSLGVGIGQSESSWRQSKAFKAKKRSKRVQNEMRDRARKNRKFLLRPNTTFSVVHRAVTVSCVAIEVATKALLAPHLSKTDRLAADEVVRYLLAPSVSYLVRIVSFVDVFVTFFTAEINQSGQLAPKPWFKRWILPGMALQLIVNPTMSDIAKLVVAFSKWSIKVGPTRMFHLLVAFRPLIEGLIHVIHGLLVAFVNAWNRKPNQTIHPQKHI